MTYMLISGTITNKCLNIILAVSENRLELEAYAQKYVEQNPGTEVHIFEWRSGFSSKPTVTTERLWDSGYIPPKSIDESSAEQVPQHDPTQ